MTGPSAWMMTPRWDAAHVTALWAMWAVMMTAMMLPSAAPLVLVHGRMAGRSANRATSAQTLALAAGYLLVWAAFSIGATAVQRMLASSFRLTPMMEAGTPALSGGLLLIAGAYQWTPLKHACLRQCQSPLSFFMTHWRRGAWGALRMGVTHGFACVGCCWALMLLLFAGGVMNLVVIAALTVVVAAEKLLPYGAWIARASGAVMIAAGAWVIAVSPR
jgi:predicted metal-binding membrane protein